MKDSLFYTINFNDVRKLWRDIRAHHSCRSESRPAVTQVFFDTFDWRLWQKDLTLIREENDLKLSDVEPLQPSLRESWRRKAQPKFWWQFPDGPMKDALQSLLGVRALMSLAAIQKTRRTMSLLNEDGKTVLKIHHDYIHLKDVSERCKNIHILWLQPIRGYKNDLQKFQKFLRERDLTKSEEWVYSRILKAVGRRPGDYTSKFRLDLTPNLNSDKALRMILRYLIDVMKSNEEGIKADTDTEFLHDFRVSSRRIRSALGQIKGVLPKDKTDQSRRDFSILGKSTNRLRDLDVYLLKKEQYRELLPKHTVGGLDPFFQDVSDARRAELNKVKKFLKSSIYRELMSRWEEFIDTEMGGPGEEAKNAQKPVFEVAQRVIFRRYGQVIRGGKGIHDQSPDENCIGCVSNVRGCGIFWNFLPVCFQRKTCFRSSGS